MIKLRDDIIIIYNFTSMSKVTSHYGSYVLEKHTTGYGSSNVRWQGVPNLYTSENKGFLVHVGVGPW